jgi:glycosyltransferase involved in cell wall biosynthesis
MKLLLITQKVDRNDPVLGFFARWIEEFAKRYERVSVICLEKGEMSLPSNVSVYSLGKEEGNSRLGYITRFYRHIWALRHDYDAVFVHMNQEYVLLGWKSWFFMGKPVYLWRNHAKGSFLTNLAVFFSKKVFCTSPESYTAKFKKTILMPAGIDTDFFKPDPAVSRVLNSVLFLGRISPVKKVLEFIDWFKALGESYTATVAGGPVKGSESYAEEVRRRAPANMRFVGPVNQEGALKLYQSHEKYVNLTPGGSLDKTILEAAACGCKVLCENTHLKIALEGKSGEEARKYVIENHSLSLLMEKLQKEIS